VSHTIDTATLDKIVDTLERGIRIAAAAEELYYAHAESGDWMGGLWEELRDALGLPEAEPGPPIDNRTTFLPRETAARLFPEAFFGTWNTP
jgi:hypothetical protein